MNFHRQILIHRQTGDRSGYIPPCGEATYDFEVEKPFEGPATHRIRLIGETDYFWRLRAECGAPYAISMAIDDALVKDDTCGEAYALEVPCHGDLHPRNAYAKLHRDELHPGETTTLAIPFKSRELVCEDYASLRLEVYRQKEGRHPDDAFDEPDLVVELPFPEGTHDWTLLSQEFTMPSDAACAIVRIGARNCTGALWTGSPRLAPKGAENPLPLLAPAQARFPSLNYLGENLSRRDWLECKISIDGREVFRGEKYSCIVRRPEYTFDAGVLAPGRHTLKIQLLNDYPSAVGFVLQGIDLLHLGNHDFEVIGAPECVSEDDSFAALVRTTVDNLTVVANGVQHRFGKAGLHALELPPLARKLEQITFASETHSDSITVEMTPKGESPVFLGTGDDVYIPPALPELEWFLEWYVANHIGNYICFRHSYRWGGGRSLDPTPWQKIIPLLNDLGLHYTLMVDGREVPGMATTPTPDLVEGPLYLGQRAHENDGSFCYWGNKIWGSGELQEPYADILSRGVTPGGIQPHIRPTRDGAEAWWFFNPRKARNMKEAAEYFVENLKTARGASTRHSGPSTLFRYFFQAGYDTLLAEQMYGPEPLVLAALRGASRAYGRSDFGTHLALQWNSTPLDSSEHADRYFLSLATSYMNGATEINTEEGLYRMESEYADYDRFSHACAIHQEAHHRFRKFLENNPRNGRFVTPVAIIQGRYDGWRCFGRANVWSNEGEQWRFGPAEESFDLLRVFYPRCKLDQIYVQKCPDAPQGWYSGTPLGYPDLLPWEGDWSKYLVVAMLGWHSFENEDAEKMARYVEEGGTLLLTRRHLSKSLKHDAPPLYETTPALERLLGEDWMDADGVVTRNVGKGKVVFFASDKYPAESPIRNDYEDTLRRLATDATQKEACDKGWILANDDVEFAAYDLQDGSRVFYLLNIRWWDGKTSTVTLQHGNTSKNISVEFGGIVVSRE